MGEGQRCKKVLVNVSCGGGTRRILCFRYSNGRAGLRLLAENLAFGGDLIILLV